MTKKSYTEFDDISYMLKKIEWPAPSRDLAYRIENALTGNMPFMSDVSVIHFRSPFLTFGAVVLAMFLCVASGFVAGGSASANDVAGDHPYVSSSLSVTGIYSGQAQLQAQ
jgi:hypothetical protein